MPARGSTPAERAPRAGRAALGGVFTDLLRFESQLRGAVDAALRERHDLSLSRFEALQVVAERDSCRLYDVCAALSLTTGGASKLVDSLEASGYCRRRPNPDDRRSSLIELTASGRRAVARASATMEAELDVRLGEALSPQALARFSTTVAKLRAAAGSARD